VAASPKAFDPTQPADKSDGFASQILDLESVVVLPLLPASANRAFIDVALPVANVVAGHLAGELPKTAIVQPGILLARLKAQGAWGLYEDLVLDLQHSQQPDSETLVALLERISQGARRVDRLVLVEAYTEVNRTGRPSHPLEWFEKWTGDVLPHDPALRVLARMRVLDTANKEHGSVLCNETTGATLRLSRLRNVTSSVDGDIDSRAAFEEVAQRLGLRLVRQLSPQAMPGMRRHAPWRGLAHTYQRVQGRLVKASFVFKEGHSKMSGNPQTQPTLAAPPSSSLPPVERP
jgi:hypothetical protein